VPWEKKSSKVLREKRERDCKGPVRAREKVSGRAKRTEKGVREDLEIQKKE